MRLAPPPLARGWCPGVYTARVVEQQTPVCKPGLLCPQYIRLVGVVGRASFRVRKTG
jgi:hypothetical protein